MAKEFTTNLGEPRKTKYQWNLWTNGSVWLAERGEDFKVTAQAFTMACRNTAKNRGLKVRIGVVSDDSVLFRFVK